MVFSVIVNWSYKPEWISADASQPYIIRNLKTLFFILIKIAYFYMLKNRFLNLQMMYDWLASAEIHSGFKFDILLLTSI